MEQTTVLSTYLVSHQRINASKETHGSFII